MTDRLSESELAALESDSHPKVARLAGEVRRLRQLISESYRYLRGTPGTEELQAELEREVSAIGSEKRGES